MPTKQPNAPHNHNRALRLLTWIVQHRKFMLLLCLLGIVAFIALKLKQCTADGTPVISVKHSTTIADTPEEVLALRNIKQWEFVSVETEELIEHHEAHTLGDKHLVKVYRGTLRIGIDMQQATDDWFSVDSALNVTLRLPDVGLLDTNFIDEARTTTFHEDGTFSAQVKQNLYNQAAEAMKRRTLTDDNLATARQKAEEQFTRIFTALGYNKVSISFTSESPSSPQEKQPQQQ